MRYVVAQCKRCRCRRCGTGTLFVLLVALGEDRFGVAYYGVVDGW